MVEDNNMIVQRLAMKLFFLKHSAQAVVKTLSSGLGFKVKSGSSPFNTADAELSYSLC